MGKPFWTGENLSNLLELSIEELVVLYPDQSVANLKRRKQEYTKKLGEAVEQLPSPDKRESREDLTAFEKLLERSGVNPNDVADITRMNVYQSSMKDENGQWNTIDQYAMQIKPRKKDTHEAFQPIEPAKITPTRRKKLAKASMKQILIYGDQQIGHRRRIDPVTDETEIIPTHNVAMGRVIHQVNADLMPETTVNLGDSIDLAESGLTRFDPDSDHFHKTLNLNLRYMHDFFAQMRADNPNAHHVLVEGNHDLRIKRAVLKNIPALYDLVRPGEEEQYAMMTTYYLANLGKLGIDYYSGWPGAEFVYGAEYGKPPVVFKHGSHSSSSPGATVRKEAAQNPTVHVIRGHGHNDEEIRVTMRDGHQLIYKQFGSACVNNGANPGYMTSIDDHNRPVKIHQNHQNTFGIMTDHMNGNYSLQTIDVLDGQANVNGKLYDGNI